MTLNMIMMNTIDVNADAHFFLQHFFKTKCYQTRFRLILIWKTSLIEISSDNDTKKKWASQSKMMLNRQYHYSCDRMSHTITSPLHAVAFVCPATWIADLWETTQQHNKPKSNQIKSNQTKSNQIKSNEIKSNQTKSNQLPRSEERRVGKECRSRGSPESKKT